MRSRNRFVIFAGDAEWRVVDGDEADDIAPTVAALPADASPEDAAAAVVTALREAIPAGATVTLALPSHWCLCARVDVADLPRSSRRQAMLYRLEEQLPLAAEEFVADFVAGGANEQSLGVAAPLRRVEPLVRALEDGGLVVDCVCPAALLAAQTYLATSGLPEGDGLLFAHDGRLELILTRGGRLAEWDVMPADADDVALELGLRALRTPPPLRLVCAAAVAPEILARLREIAQLEVTDFELPPPCPAAVRAARAAGDGGAAPWVELRRDALDTGDPYRPARRAMNVVIVAAIACCACVCGALLWRAAAYHRVAADYERAQADAFAVTFGGNRPAEGLNIASRLASEERRLRALAGESLDLPARASALAVLQRVLSRLPADARCRVDELRINEDKLYVEGTAPSHADAATFAAALAAEPGFVIDAPNTEQLASGAGVSMRVTGTAAPAPPGPQAAAARGEVGP